MPSHGGRVDISEEVHQRRRRILQRIDPARDRPTNQRRAVGDHRVGEPVSTPMPSSQSGPKSP
jgi:hypothetical protein